ncbi:MAG: BatD family protein [Phycisphaerales bacterium]|nr:BatD family protein [Phycisphaerales bacterium]
MPRSLHFINRCLTIALLAAGASALSRPASAQDVSVDYGARQIWVGEPTQVTFTVNNATDVGEPVLPKVDGLKIEYSGARNTSSSITIINGVRSESTSMNLVIEITPEHPGDFRIPPIQITVDGATLETEGFTFKAVEPTNDGRLIVDVIRAGGPVYVGEPIDLTLRIWIRQFHSESYDITVNERTTWQLIKQSTEWGPFEESLEKMTRAGRRPAGKEVKRAEGDYWLYEITRQLRPSGSGFTDDLEGVLVRISYPTGITESRSRSIFRRSELTFSGLMPISEPALVKGIDVKPLPDEGRPDTFRGAVGDFIVRAGARPTDVAVGDPITLTFLVGSVDNDPTVLQTLRPPPLAELSELTDSFRIPKDPIAGEIEDTIKVFTQTLRPLNDSVTEIPSIPFSFFDPDLESYRTVYTKPIPIKVSPAEMIAASDIVRSGGGASSMLTEVDQTSGDDDGDRTGLQANFPVDQRMLAQDTITLGAVSMTLATVPPACFVAVLLVAGRRRWKNAHPALVRANGAHARAKTGVKQADDVMALGLALRGYVCDRTGRPAASLTSNETLRLARQAGADAPTIASMDELFRAAERSGYGGMSESHQEHATTAMTLLGALDRCHWVTPEEVDR